MQTTGMKTRSDLIRHGRVIVRFVRVLRRKVNATTGMKTRTNQVRHGRVIVSFVRVLHWKEICTSTEGTRLGALKTRASA